MKIRFPYKKVPSVDIPEGNLLGIFEAKSPSIECSEDEVVKKALRYPIGSKPLHELARGKNNILIIVDDISRPTPAHRLVPHILDELFKAGIKQGNIEFLLALGSHRPMNREEMVAKLGRNIVNNYRVSNHDWGNENELEYMGDTEQGVPVWVNKKVSRADMVIGVGRIMPIDICGFTGGGKIVIPGVCGKITNEKMHWVRANISNEDVIGKRDNPVRESIDKLARKAGLDFILNIVMVRGGIADAFAGDMIEAHRIGSECAGSLHRVKIPQFADIVIADSYPFDIEFWQANKALDTCGLVVRKGGVIILISPCYEGFSSVHENEILKFGYRPVKEIKELVMTGAIKTHLVGVHMIQVSQVAIERAKCILVTDGISRDNVQRVGLEYAETPAAALEKAFEMVGHDAKVAVLRYAAEMLPEIG